MRKRSIGRLVGARPMPYFSDSSPLGRQRLSTPNQPPTQHQLQRQSSPPEYGRDRNRARFYWISRHINVRRKYRNQERDQSPHSRTAGLRQQQPQASENFTTAAGPHHRQVCWDVGRHDSQIRIGLDEMQRAGHYVEDGG